MQHSKYIFKQASRSTQTNKQAKKHKETSQLNVEAHDKTWRFLMPVWYSVPKSTKFTKRRKKIHRKRQVFGNNSSIGILEVFRPIIQLPVAELLFHSCLHGCLNSDDFCINQEPTKHCPHFLTSIGKHIECWAMLSCYFPNCTGNKYLVNYE